MLFLTLLLVFVIFNLAYSQSIDTLRTVDAAGNIVKVEYYEEGVRRNYLNHYEYDPNNRLIKEYMTDTLGEILSRIGLAPIFVYEYRLIDGKESKIEYCYDKNMQPDVLDIPPFYHKVIHTYNSKKQVIERWGMSRNGDTKFRMAYTYNEHGLEEQIKYLDADGNIEKDNVGILELKYDAQKRLICEENYDYKHRPYSTQYVPFRKEISYLGNIECVKIYDKNLNVVHQEGVELCAVASNFELKSLDNTIVTLDDFKGHTVVLYFWSSTFRGAPFLNPRIFPAFKKYQSKVKFIAVGIEKPENYEKWQEAIVTTQINWAINLGAFNSFDSKIAKDYYINYLPLFFVINKDGFIVGSELTGIQNVIKLLDQLEK
ncbi:TlpA disulfide reductase family protein [Aureispira sp. CCB-E]|uniref:TlpA family protein disulfide reductase n=1 Tax=Aureispira sp. CCB-E TaxID=3051121 RepID=UPI002868C92A|nr:TlpA disulfide reductase family protein [Aureispira sp. CCB-E]WMX16885.1 TlpA disulfide reductase family protein [Aureispira sp. CCB-E]